MRRLYVLPERRRRGVAQRLVKEIIRIGAPSGAAIYVNAGDAHAAALWLAIGFGTTTAANRTHRLLIAEKDEPDCAT
jgi:GNAT superfamily N-acetyltransferase